MCYINKKIQKDDEVIKKIINFIVLWKYLEFYMLNPHRMRRKATKKKTLSLVLRRSAVLRPLRLLPQLFPAPSSIKLKKEQK